MKFTEQIFSKKFSDDNAKNAYLKACKWLAKNIISNEKELGDLSININRIDEERPTYKITLSVHLDEKEVRERHCRICKESHNAFFINQETNCAWCNSSAYQRRLSESIKSKKEYYKTKLREMLK